MLLAGISFAATGCYEDPYYGSHRGVRSGYYASYGGPAPYYGYEPYGYGYGPGIAVGVSSYRSHPGYVRGRYYGRSGYRSGYRRGYDRYDGRRYDRRRWDGRRGDGRRGDGRNWERRDRNRSGERRATSERNRAIRRMVAPQNRSTETQPE